MNFKQGKNKNLTGMTVVALLHVVLLAVFLHGSKLTVFHAPDAAISVTPTIDPPKPKPLDPQVPPPTLQEPVIVVPVLEVAVTPPAQPTVTAQTMTDTPPAQLPAHAGTPADNGVKAQPSAAPVLVPAVVDARACAKPDYPKNALRNEETGVVSLSLLIGTDGRVADSKIEKSSGFRELDRAAQVGLGLCRFKPGTVDGVPQQSWTKMQYVWSLD